MGVNTSTVQRIFKSAGETRNAGGNLIGKLDDGELLTGTPTVLEVSTSDLTLTNKVVNTAALTLEGVSVAVGQAVQFSVAGGTAGSTYQITCTCGTDSTPAQTVKQTVTLVVEADA